MQEIAFGILDDKTRMEIEPDKEYGIPGAFFEMRLRSANLANVWTSVHKTLIISPEVTWANLVRSILNPRSDKVLVTK